MGLGEQDVRAGIQEAKQCHLLVSEWDGSCTSGTRPKHIGHFQRIIRKRQKQRFMNVICCVCHMWSAVQWISVHKIWKRVTRDPDLESRSVEAFIGSCHWYTNSCSCVICDIVKGGEEELCVTVTPSGEDTKLRPNTIIKSLPNRLIGQQGDNRKSCSNIMGCLSNRGAHLRGFVKFSFTVAPLAPWENIKRPLISGVVGKSDILTTE